MTGVSASNAGFSHGENSGPTPVPVQGMLHRTGSRHFRDRSRFDPAETDLYFLTANIRLDVLIW